MSPSVGNKKSSVDVDLRIVAPPIVIPATEYIGYILDQAGNVIPCAYDVTGAYIADLCSPFSDQGIDDDHTSGPLATGCFVYIATDSGGFASNGSIATIEPFGKTLYVFDPAGSSLSASIGTSGWALSVNGYVHGFMDGWIYWGEIQTNSISNHDFRVQKCRLDGSGLATVNAFNITGGAPHYASITGLLMQSDAAVLTLAETGGNMGFARFPLSGGTVTFNADFGTFAGYSTHDDPSGPGLAAGSAAFAKTDSFGSPPTHPFGGFRWGTYSNASDPVMTGRWPSSFGSGMSFGALSVNLAGDEASAFDSLNVALIRNSITSVGGSPTTALTFEAHPTITVPPFASPATPDAVFIVT